MNKDSIGNCAHPEMCKYLDYNSLCKKCSKYLQKMKNKKEIDKLITEDLEAFRELKDNWDSYGGKPITGVALEQAKYFLDLFIAPTSEGGILITLGDNEDIAIEIHSNGTWEVEK